jgi:hypothetical protein
VFGRVIRSLLMVLIGVCLGRDGLGVLGGIQGCLLEIGRGSGGRCKSVLIEES